MASERRARQAHRRDQSRRFDTSTLAVRGYDLTFSYCRHRRIDRNNHGRQGGIALEDLSRAQSAGLKVLGELLAAEYTLQLGEQGRTSAENQGCGLRGVDQLSSFGARTSTTNWIRRNQAVSGTLHGARCATPRDCRASGSTTCGTLSSHDCSKRANRITLSSRSLGISSGGCWSTTRTFASLRRSGRWIASRAGRWLA